MRGSNGMRDFMPLVAVIGCLAAIVGAGGLWRTGAKTSERACIERAEAKYPAVAVSAFVTNDKRATGPLKVSFASERAKAVDDC